jgi:CBS domain-containing protein
MPKITGDELRPLLMSLLFVGLGLVLLWAARYWINDPATAMGDAVFVALLVMPVLIYAIISGRLTEFRGPGGVGASFNAIVTTSVSETVGQDPVTLDQQSVQMVDKGDLSELHKKIRGLDEVTPVVLTLTFGGGHYSLEALQKYMEGLSRSRNFKLVVFLAKDKRFLAYMPSWAAKTVLDTPNMGEEFVRVINDGDAKLFQYPSVVQKTISTRSTHAEALREMIDRNIEAMVVTDETNHLQGIAEREQILSKMMLALTEKK